MKNKNKKRNGMLVLLLLLVCFIAVGYAALSTSLKIDGTSNIGGASWDVHFENLQVTDGSVGATTDAAIQGDETSISYAVDLNTPGDFYEFTVDVVNKGGIDAKVSKIPDISGVSASQDVYINYTVTYEDGTNISADDLLSKNTGVKTLKVRVEFDKNIDASQLPSTGQTLNLKFAVDYVQP